MEFVIVGAGLTGLAAAVQAHESGHDVVVIEASDGPGGRVRTDTVDGFRLDRGFQILLTAYPEAQHFFDYDKLDMRSFSPGALVRLDKGFSRVGDPFREPTTLLDTARAPIGSVLDKARILAFRRSVTRGGLAELWRRPETTARHRLSSFGFSDTIIERFMGPLFTGITLDPQLSGSSRVLDFVFRMLSTGSAGVPADGMGQLAAQLADRLPAGTIRYETPVAALEETKVVLADGETIQADAIVIATDQNEAARLTGGESRGWRSVTSVWFAAEQAPLDDPILVLNGTGSGAVNSMAVMSSVSPSYAPPGKSLIVASAPGTGGDVTEALRDQLAAWFPAAASWEVLRVDHIDKAQPTQPVGHHRRMTLSTGPRTVVCGDHLTDPSINGALASGRSAVETLSARP